MAKDKGGRNNVAGDKPTIMEESLCQAMMTASSQSEAFRMSKYSSENMDKPGVTKEASRHFAKPRVRRRMAELTEMKEAATMYSAKKLLDDLLEVLEVAKREALAGGGAQQVTAFKGLADTIGKHVDVKAWDKTVTLEAGASLELILEEARKRAGGAD